MLAGAGARRAGPLGALRLDHRRQARPTRSPARGNGGNARPPDRTGRPRPLRAAPARRGAAVAGDGRRARRRRARPRLPAPARGDRRRRRGPGPRRLRDPRLRRAGDHPPLHDARRGRAGDLLRRSACSAGGCSSAAIPGAALAGLRRRRRPDVPRLGAEPVRPAHRSTPTSPTRRRSRATSTTSPTRAPSSRSAGRSRCRTTAPSPASPSTSMSSRAGSSAPASSASPGAATSSTRRAPSSSTTSSSTRTTRPDFNTTVPPGFHRVAGNQSWVLYRRCPMSDGDRLHALAQAPLGMASLSRGRKPTMAPADDRSLAVAAAGEDRHVDRRPRLRGRRVRTSAADGAPRCTGRAAGSICYLDVGSWESYRPDAGRFPSR